MARPDGMLKAKIEQLQKIEPYRAWHGTAISALRYALGEEDNILGEPFLRGVCC